METKRLRQKLDDLIMAMAALLAKVLFIAYSTASNFIMLLIFILWTAFLLIFSVVKHTVPGYWWYPVWLVGLSFLYALLRPGPPKDNPYREYEDGLRGRIEKCNDGLIAWVGKIKYFCSPISVVEDPGSYKITGAEIRDLIDRMLEPGDILLRGYDGYVDGIAIRNTGGGTGMAKYFSHAALYVGPITDPGDRGIAARRLKKLDKKTCQWVEASEDDKEKIRNNTEYYQPGRQMVIHSMTRGVFVEDILTFTRCDYLAVLRIADAIRLEENERTEDRCLIRELSDEAEKIRTTLMKGGSVMRSEVIETARKSALGKIGSCYDFQFNDIKTENRFSCSEFVYYCFKSIHCYLGLKPQIHGLFNNILFQRLTISPADVYNAAVNEKKLKVVWTSRSLDNG